MLLTLPLLLLLTLLLYVSVFGLLLYFFMLSIYLFLSFLLFFFLIDGFGFRLITFFILMVHLLVLDFNADVLVELFVALDQVGDLAEHVRLDLQLHELLSQVLNGEVLRHLVSLLFQFLLESLWLVWVVKDNLQTHLCSLNRDHCLQVFNKIKGLLLR